MLTVETSKMTFQCYGENIDGCLNSLLNTLEKKTILNSIFSPLGSHFRRDIQDVTCRLCGVKCCLSL